MIGTLKHLLNTGDTLTLIISIIFFIYSAVIIGVSKKIINKTIAKRIHTATAIPA